MARIIEVTGEKIVVGKDSGEITEVRLSDIKFAPCVGDEVDVFEKEGRTFVLKKDAKKQTEHQNGGGISINLANTQTNTNSVHGAGHAHGQVVVKKSTYVLLAFFLGVFGAHKFYAGKSGSGIMYLLLCWTGITSFLALIDFIVGITKRSDCNGCISI